MLRNDGSGGNMVPAKSDIGRENSPDQGDHPEELPFSQPPREAGSLGLVAIFSAASTQRKLVQVPEEENRHFFRVPKKPARAARGARSAPEGPHEAPRSGAGCRAAAQSAAAGG